MFKSIPIVTVNLCWIALTWLFQGCKQHFTPIILIILKGRDKLLCYKPMCINPNMSLSRLQIGTFITSVSKKIIYAILILTAWNIHSGGDIYNMSCTFSFHFTRRIINWTIKWDNLLFIQNSHTLIFLELQGISLKCPSVLQYTVGFG